MGIRRRERETFGPLDFGMVYQIYLRFNNGKLWSYNLSNLKYTETSKLFVVCFQCRRPSPSQQLKALLHKIVALWKHSCGAHDYLRSMSSCLWTASTLRVFIVAKGCWKEPGAILWRAIIRRSLTTLWLQCKCPFHTWIFASLAKHTYTIRLYMYAAAWVHIRHTCILQVYFGVVTFGASSFNSAY